MTERIITRTGLTMGGTFSLRQAASAPDGLAIVQAACDRIEAQMSAWRADSALSRLNRAPVGDWVDIPVETETVITAGIGLMRRAPGAFSILMGGVAARAGFQPGAPRPGAADPDLVQVARGAARRLGEVSVDLNAIAKGYAADLAVRDLIAAGHQGGMVEVAGDLRAFGFRPDALPWTAAVELPLADRILPARLVPVFDQGLAASGGYRRARDGRSHLACPRTGQPLPDRAEVVAVLAPTGIEADGWATALAVLGPEAGFALAERHDLAALWITREATGFTERGTRAMARSLGLAA